MQTPALHTPLRTLAERVAALNPDAGRIGAGMLTQLVSEARCALADGGAGDAAAPATSTLMTMAAQGMHLKHAREREALAHRYDELDAIAQALAGAPVTVIGVTLMHTGRESAPDGRGRLSNDVLVHAEAMAVDEPAVRAALAGLRPFGSPQGSTLFEHPEAHWLLSVRWMETPIVPEEIAA